MSGWSITMSGQKDFYLLDPLFTRQTYTNILTALHATPPKLCTIDKSIFFMNKSNEWTQVDNLHF